MTAVTRFAPSPNGHLHVGHALSAIIAHDAARKNGGRFLLRIEDIDLERRRPEFVDAIYEDLAWLGLAWEAARSGPVGAFCGIPQGGRQADRDGASLSVLCDAGGDRGRMPIRRTPIRTARRFIRGFGRGASVDAVSARMAAGEAPALRLDMDGALKALARKRGDVPLTFTEIGEDGTRQTIVARAAALGRCRDRPQGGAGELSPIRRRR